MTFLLVAVLGLTCVGLLLRRLPDPLHHEDER